MNLLSAILLVVGILMFLEALSAIFFPKLIKRMTKDPKKLRKAGIIELIAAIVLIVIGVILSI